MSTIKAKNIKQTVVGTTIQPLKIGGILDDGSDAKLTIGTDGNVSLNNLSNTLNLISGQIKFPATQNPSADANTLDDYEEGTWTPTPDIGTFSTANGKYTKIGNLVNITFYITVGTGGGHSFGGLPFTANENPTTTPYCSGQAFVSGYTYPMFIVSSIFIHSRLGGNSLLYDNMTYSNGAAIVGNVSYRVA